MNGIDVKQAAYAYFKLAEHREVSIEGTATFVTEPKHGELEALGPLGNGVYRHRPANGYFGFDRPTFLVEIGGFRVKMIVAFNILPDGIAGLTFRTSRA